jgi:hypothetical protein
MTESDKPVKSTSQTETGISKIAVETSRTTTGKSNILAAPSMTYCWVFKFKTWSNVLNPVIQMVTVNATNLTDARKVFKTNYPNSEIQDVDQLTVLTSL